MMRRIRVLIAACGLALAASSASQAQDVLAGDVAGFGPAGISNGFGYRMRQLGMRGGYWTPLYYPLDAGNGPGVYYLPTFSSINGTPTPAAAERGWSYSPPWSKAYRQGEPRQALGLFGRRKA